MGHVTVVGAGAWGTALGLLLAGKGDRVTLWTWQAAHARAMQRDRENREFFPGFQLPDAISPTSDLALALAGTDLVVLVVPAQVFRETLVLARPHLPPRAAVVSATKGI